MDKQNGSMIRVGIGVMLLRDRTVLLGHRVENGRDTGGIFEPDSWCLPGGKLEYGETLFSGAAREVMEETGLTITNPQVFSAADDMQPGKHYVTIQILAEVPAGEPRVMEPDKQDAWQWFPLDALPANLYSPSQKFLDRYLAETAGRAQKG